MSLFVKGQKHPPRTPKAASRSILLRRQFLDSGVWDDLARTAGVRLPNWDTSCVGNMRRWLTKLGLSVAEYKAEFGGRTLGDWPRLNPTWPLRSWVGLLLEYLAGRERKAC